jgi:hypothetical protein
VNKLFLDVVGLALLSEANKKVYFVDSSTDRTAIGHNAHIPAHYVFLGIPTDQQSGAPPRQPIFTYQHQAASVLFGPRAKCDAFVLARDNDLKTPSLDEFVEITLGNVQSTGAAGSTANILDMAPVVKNIPLPANTVDGTERAVAAILDSSGAEIRAIHAGKELEYGSYKGLFAHCIQLVFDVPDGQSPKIMVSARNPNGPVKSSDTFVLDRPAAMNGGVTGWHLYLANVPFGELFGYSMPPHNELHHFEPMYDLYGYTAGQPRPVPKKPKPAVAAPPRLSDPGYCGPPVKS